MISVKDINKTKDVSSSKIKKSSGGGDFSLYLNQASKTDTSPISHSSPISITDAIFATQEADGIEEREKKKKLLKRAENLIDKLDEIRNGLLAGYISKDKLIEISRFVKENKPLTTDEKLVEIISDIELRVEVELAKLMR